MAKERIYEATFEQWVNAPRRTQIGKGKRLRIFERDNGRCRRCESRQNLEIDHIIPRVCGGTNDDSNLRLLCRKCNIARNIGAVTLADGSIVWRSRA